MLLISVIARNTASAAFFEANSEIKISDEIDGNTYLAGETINYNTKVNGDLFIAGQYIEMQGEVTQDVNLAGQDIKINTDINGDLRIAGQDIKISNNINGESIIFGETITIEDEAELNGDVLIYAKTININGSILGNTNLKAENIIINGNLNGLNNQLVSASLDISDTANISSNTRYWAEDYIIPTNLENNLFLDSALKNKDPKKENSSILNISGFIVLRIIWASTVIIVLHLLFTKKITQNLKSLNSPVNYIENLFLGFFIIVIIPIFSLALMITFIGLPLGMLILILYFIILFISQSITSLYISNLLNTKLDLGVSKIQIYLMALGIYTLFLLLETIPYLDILGIITSILFFLIFIGNIITNLKLKENK